MSQVVKNVLNIVMQRPVEEPANLVSLAENQAVVELPQSVTVSEAQEKIKELIQTPKYTGDDLCAQGFHWSPEGVCTVCGMLDAEDPELAEFVGLDLASKIEVDLGELLAVCPVALLHQEMQESLAEHEDSRFADRIAQLVVGQLSSQERNGDRPLIAYTMLDRVHIVPRCEMDEVVAWHRDNQVPLHVPRVTQP